MFSSPQNSLTLKKKILAEIAKRPQKLLRLDEFVLFALYDQENGFYSKGGIIFGKEGDFVTSSSVGYCFGELLADFFADFFATKSDRKFRIIEQGAGNGVFATDCLRHLRGEYPLIYEDLTYIFVEHLSKARRYQAKILADFTAKTHWFKSISDISQNENTVNVFFCNELLDSLPPRKFIRKDEVWLELFIGEQSGELHEFYQKADVEARDFLTKKTGEEIIWQKDIAEVINEVGKILNTGDLAIFIDYGYSPSNEGSSRDTLRAYRDQRLLDFSESLQFVGDCDLTCGVDFDELEAEADIDFNRIQVVEQGRFLNKIAQKRLLAMRKQETLTVGDKKYLRQLQTLTHPSFFGAKFWTFIFQKK